MGGTVTFIVAATGIALLAFFVRGFSGFGAALVMTPLLLFLYDLRTVVAVTALVSVASGVVVAGQTFAYVDRGQLRRLLVVGVPGIVVGALLLARVDGEQLARVFGLLTAAFAARMLLAQRAGAGRRGRWPEPLAYLAGALSGVMGGAFGTSGPPILVYLENQVAARQALRATLLTYFVAVDSVRLVLYGVGGLLTWRALGLSLAMLPVSIIGGQAGAWLHTRVDERPFRLAVAGLLFATGMLLVMRDA